VPIFFDVDTYFFLPIGIVAYVKILCKIPRKTELDVFYIKEYMGGYLQFSYDFGRYIVFFLIHDIIFYRKRVIV